MIGTPLEDGMVILVVEDDPLTAMTLELTLARAGYQVLGPAATTTEALNLVKTTRPDLALVDINLSEDGNGVVLARELRRQGVLSLFTSGQSGEARANTDAAIGYIGKPYTPELVLESIAMVRAALDGDRVPDAPFGLEIFRERASAARPA